MAVVSLYSVVLNDSPTTNQVHLKKIFQFSYFHKEKMVGRWSPRVEKGDKSLKTIICHLRLWSTKAQVKEEKSHILITSMKVEFSWKP